MNEPTRFVRVSVSGSMIVKVIVPSASNQYRIEALNGGTPEVLASFSGTVGVQNVTLNRVLQEEEEIQLYDVTAGKVTNIRKVASGTATRILRGRVEGGLLRQDGTLTFRGVNIGGNEVVHARINKDDPANWTTVTVNSSTTETLAVTIPDLGITTVDRVVFRVTTFSGQEFFRFVIVANENFDTGTG